MKLVIVDYGMGNIRSIKSSLNYIGVQEVILSSKYEVLKSADKLILPGVGSFGKAMRMIKERNLDKSIYDIVIKDNKPLLGICLGMQLLGKSSTEDGENLGLGFINADIKRFSIKDLKIPHVGFNQVYAVNDSRLFCGLPPFSDFYFTHSYRMTSNIDINQSYCDYGEKFIAAFENKNIAGVQFHPELSQFNGLSLLKNFINKF